MASGVKFSGPWKKTKTTLSKLGDVIFGPPVKDLKKAADEIKAEVQKNMESSPPPPLALPTVIKKTRMGLAFPKRSWYATGWMIREGLEVKVEKKSRSRLALKVMVTQKRHPGSDLTAEQLFSMLEMGTTKMPPRPVLQPVVRKLRGHKPEAIFSDTTLRIRDRLKIALG